MIKEELITEARECLAQHSEYSEVFGETFVAVDTLTAMVDFAEPREKRIAELEKENAELKYQLTHRNCLDCSNHSSKLRMRTLELEKECTNAKEIIKKFLLWENDWHEKTESKYKLLKQAEQFLSEVEK